MVQVDVIWSYAFGASFAAASARQLSEEPKAFNNRHFIRLLVYLSCYFGPSGLFLLWAFPRWETMQVATSLDQIPPWLVTLFGITNITQGIIGYWVGYRFARQKEYYKANLNWYLAWIVFWFVLACGWDTTGWQRFLYDPVMNHYELWEPGRHNGIWFFFGPVFTSLVIMGAFFAPALQNGVVDECYKSLRLDSESRSPTGLEYLRLTGATYGSMFVGTLILAVISSFIVRGCVVAIGNMLFGYVAGLLISIVLGYFLLVRRGMPLHRFMRRFYDSDKHDLVAIGSTTSNSKTSNSTY